MKIETTRFFGCIIFQRLKWVEKHVLKFLNTTKKKQNRGLSTFWRKYINVDQILKPFRKKSHHTVLIPMIKSNMSIMLHVYVHQSVIYKSKTLKTTYLSHQRALIMCIMEHR